MVTKAQIQETPPGLFESAQYAFYTIEPALKEVDQGIEALKEAAILKLQQPVRITADEGLIIVKKYLQYQTFLNQTLLKASHLLSKAIEGWKKEISLKIVEFEKDLGCDFSLIVASSKLIASQKLSMLQAHLKQLQDAQKEGARKLEDIWVSPLLEFCAQVENTRPAPFYSSFAKSAEDYEISFFTLLRMRSLDVVN